MVGSLSWLTFRSAEGIRMWVELRNLRKGRRSSYENLSPDDNVPSRPGLSTCRTFGLLVITAGLCFVVLYAASSTFSALTSGSQGDVVLLSSNGLSDARLDHNSNSSSALVSSSERTKHQVRRGGLIRISALTRPNLLVHEWPYIQPVKYSWVQNDDLAKNSVNYFCRGRVFCLTRTPGRATG